MPGAALHESAVIDTHEAESQLVSPSLIRGERYVTVPTLKGSGVYPLTWPPRSEPVMKIGCPSVEMKAGSVPEIVGSRNSNWTKGSDADDATIFPPHMRERFDMLGA
eukprot:3934624-Rhodomonas_salina.3